MKDRIAALLLEGKSYGYIVSELGCSKSYVAYHSRRLGLTRTNNIRVHRDWVSVQEFYDRGNSIRECLLEFDLCRSAWYMAVSRGHLTLRPRKSACELVTRASVKNRILKEGILAHMCANCGLPPVWMEKPLVLVLDHINGVRDDHRLENLRLLCPNCNSQTETFAGRNMSRNRSTGRTSDSGSEDEGSTPSSAAR